MIAHFAHRENPFRVIVFGDVGCDLGDEFSLVCVLNDLGQVDTRRIQEMLSTLAPRRIAIEVGTYSRFSKLLKGARTRGHA